MTQPATPPRFVLPGTEVGIEEEYAAGAGTYVEDAKIYASMAGLLHEADRTLSVSRQGMLETMKPGTVLIGRIEMISEPVALVLVEADKEDTGVDADITANAGLNATGADAASGGPNASSGSIRHGTSSAYCVLHASYVKRGFVKNVRDELKVGDIIRAKVVEYKNGEYRISTDDEECGCLKAFCTLCRSGLEKKPTGLQCPNCENRENRRMAPDYGEGI